MQFDFSGLRHDTPKRMTVVCADKNEFTVSMKDKRGRIRFFRIRPNAPGQFDLWSWSADIDGRYDHVKGHFVMRSDLARVLTLIGYYPLSKVLRAS